MTKPLPPALRFMRVASSQPRIWKAKYNQANNITPKHHITTGHNTAHHIDAQVTYWSRNSTLSFWGGIDALISSVASYTNRRAPPHQNRIPLKNAHTRRRPKPEKQKKEMICINLPGSLQALSTRAIARLGDDLDDSTGFLDLLLGQLGDESGLDDERLVDSALAELETWEKEQNILSVAVDRTRGRGGRRLTSLCLLS